MPPWPVQSSDPRFACTRARRTSLGAVSILSFTVYARAGVVTEESRCVPSALTAVPMRNRRAGANSCARRLHYPWGPSGVIGPHRRTARSTGYRAIEHGGFFSRASAIGNFVHDRKWSPRSSCCERRKRNRGLQRRAERRSSDVATIASSLGRTAPTLRIPSTIDALRQLCRVARFPAHAGLVRLSPAAPNTTTASRLSLYRLASDRRRFGELTRCDGTPMSGELRSSSSCRPDDGEAFLRADPTR